MTTENRKLEIHKGQARDRLRAVGVEHQRLRDALEGLENTRDAEIMAARRLGMTMQEIADLVNLTKGRVSQIEKGIR